MVFLNDIRNTFLCLTYRLLHLVYQLELLLNRMPGLRRQFIQGLFQQPPPFPAKKVTYLLKHNPILGKSGMDTILKFSPYAYQYHAHTGELPLVTQFPRRDPDCGQSAITRQNSQSSGIKFISLIYLTHHKLSLACMYQRRSMPRFFHFIKQPVPVTGALDSNGRARGKSFKKRAKLLSIMFYLLSREYFSLFTNCRKNRVFLMCVTSDIIFHAAITPPLFVFCFFIILRSIAAFSYNQ